MLARTAVENRGLLPAPVAAAVFPGDVVVSVAQSLPAVESWQWLNSVMVPPMFIQSAPPGRPQRAIMMHDHTALSGQIARAFGNAEFEPPSPLDEVVYAIANHDAGWAAFDRDPATDPETGMPYSVFSTPARHILPTSRASPDFNERHHLYSGLLSSMHTWGIYNGRYGFSSAGRLNRIAPEDKPAVEAMLAHELERQGRLKAVLARSRETADWVQDDKLFQNYKLLQLCDLLAIYFNYTHAEARAEQTFTHAPRSRSDDVSVTIRPRGNGVYALAPFPFASSGSEFAFAAREINPRQHEAEGGWSGVLWRAPVVWETFKLVSG
jgi:hypothetical protein